MANFYCKYCGASFPNVMALSRGDCFYNPHGKKHELYEGSEKRVYTCKYCGAQFPNLVALTRGNCFKNPNGKRHEPAL